MEEPEFDFDSRRSWPPAEFCAYYDLSKATYHRRVVSGAIERLKVGAKIIHTPTQRQKFERRHSSAGAA